MWFQHHNGGQPTSGTVSGTVLNNWHHMVASYNAGQMTYTIDGVASGPFAMDPSARLATGQIGAWNGSRVYIGQFDDWAIWTGESLSTAETTGIYNLATSMLNYNAQNADELFGVFNGESASANIGGLTWVPAADGTLGGSAGNVLDLGGGAFALVLNGVGGGVQTTLPPVVPEPSTFALAFLGLLWLGMIGGRRKRR